MFIKSSVIFAVISGNILCFIISSSLTWSTPVLPKLANSTTSPLGRALETEEISWISSILTLGAVMGNYLFNYLSEKMGKRVALLIGGVLSLISNLMLAFSYSVNFFYIARFLSGIALGSYSIFPVYIGELSYKKHRGILGSTLSCSGSTGLLFSNAVGPFVSIKTFSLILASFSAMFLLFFSYFGVEVPYYYLERNEHDIARETLQKFRGKDEDVEEAFNEIQSAYMEGKKGSWRDIFASKAPKKAFIICTVLMASQQFCGVTAVLFYGQSFFKNKDFQLSPEISIIIVSIVYCLSSFLASALIVKVKRKTLYMISALGIATAEIFLCLYNYFESSLPKYLSTAPLICLVLVILLYNIGLGPLPWLYIGEMFSSRIRTFSNSIVVAIYWAIAFVLTKYFMYMVEAMSLHGYFAFSATFCIVFAFIVKYYVIETKDKSLEEIQNELSK